MVPRARYLISCTSCGQAFGRWSSFRTFRKSARYIATRYRSDSRYGLSVNTRMTFPPTGPTPTYQPHRLSVVPGSEVGSEHAEEDWTASLDLSRAVAAARASFGPAPLRVLVLYGSLRQRLVLRLCALDCHLTRQLTGFRCLLAQYAQPRARSWRSHRYVWTR